MQLNQERIEKPLVILLDVYETLLDMTEVEKRLNALMDSSRGYTIWFELFMQYCFVDNCTGQYHDFSSIAKATMQMAGRTLGRNVSDDEINHVFEILKHLPVHAGVQKGLSELIDKGYRIAALTNSPEKIIKQRMEPSGLISFFEMVLSAETIKKYKPCIEVYDWAASKLETKTSRILLVTAHGWDIAGAVNAGMQTAYLKQGRQMLYPLAPKPDFTCTSLDNLVTQLETLNEEEKQGQL